MMLNTIPREELKSFPIHNSPFEFHRQEEAGHIHHQIEIRAPQMPQTFWKMIAQIDILLVHRGRSWSYSPPDRNPIAPDAADFLENDRADRYSSRPSRKKLVIFTTRSKSDRPRCRRLFGK